MIDSRLWSLLDIVGFGHFEVSGGVCLIDSGLDRWRLRNFGCNGVNGLGGFEVDCVKWV